MDFRTIHTSAGLIAMAEAEAAGTPINLTEMAVGDGNANPVEPSADQTQLARERYRAAVNRVYQDPEEPRRITALTQFRDRVLQHAMYAVLEPLWERRFISDSYACRVGKGTADAVYGMLFDDAEATAKYDSVYSREPYEVDDGEGGTTTVTPPERFGVMA